MASITTTWIIDDDPIFVYGTKQFIQMTDFCDEVVVFQDGQEALDQLRSKLAKSAPLPDVILLDLNMPIMDGWGFLDELNSIPHDPRIPIYVLTSSINPEDRARTDAYQLGIQYIVKPINQSDLKKILQDLSA